MIDIQPDSFESSSIPKFCNFIKQLTRFDVEGPTGTSIKAGFITVEERSAELNQFIKKIPRVRDEYSSLDSKKFSIKHIRACITQMNDSDHDCEKFDSVLSRYIIGTQQLHKNLGNEFINFNFCQNSQLEFEDAQRRKERRSFWRLWFDRIIRWFFSVIFAVFLYSVLKQIDTLEFWRIGEFIELPVIDLLNDAME